VCQARCYILGGREILGHVSRNLDIAADETTKDGFIHVGNGCVPGLLRHGPVVAIDQNLYGKSTVQSADEILNQLKKSEKGS